MLTDSQPDFQVDNYLQMVGGLGQRELSLFSYKGTNSVTKTELPPSWHVPLKGRISKYYHTLILRAMNITQQQTALVSGLGTCVIWARMPFFQELKVFFLSGERFMV